MRFLYHSFLALFSLGFLGLIAGVGLFAFVISYYGSDLPEYKQLKEYQPNVMTRIYAANGDLLAEYAREKRVFMPVQKIPPIVKQAFLAAEDQNFYEHNGIDPVAIGRAVITNIKNVGSGRRLVGASTITQQVAKNFLLTNEVSFERKIKEAILATRLEKALTKDQLLELYLNEIFLGQRAYGVAAAAQIYFDKSLDELSIAEAAYLAALPKAPNNYHPVRKKEAAIARRNWVISRMLDEDYIETAQAEIAQEKPLEMAARNFSENIQGDFFAEDVRRLLEEKYGVESLYQGGLTVRTSLNPEFQNIAVQSLRNGLMAYDKRHGWRGPIATLKSMENWQESLSKIAKPKGQIDEWNMVVVTRVSNEKATIGFEDGSLKTLPLKGVKWARECLQDCYALGPEITEVSDVLSKGQVVFVEKTEDDEGTYYVLRQVPKVQGAIIALDPHTGRVLAMQGGWDQSSSSFNRATQAQRQPGSSFKPFVYLAAFEDGFTPSTLVLDGPIAIEQNPGAGDYWRPTNYSNKFYGPSTLRMGLEKSRNLMTVRLADTLGMGKVVDYAARFGIAEDMKEFLSYSLGAGETTLLRLTAAYGMLANGGKKIEPTLIDRIQDRTGETVFSYDMRDCINCGDLIRWDGQLAPDIVDSREQIADEKTVFQIVSLMEGVVQRGTATRLKSLNRPVAGKTGTTNESKDAWFIGFTPNLVVGVFVGFDDPKSMGKRETGSSVAAPIFGEFVGAALKDTPPVPFKMPSGMKNVRVDKKTGRLASASSESVIWESFIAGTEPTEDYSVIDTATLDSESYNDPYGYGQYGYDFLSPEPTFSDGSVTVYGLESTERRDLSNPVYSPNNIEGQNRSGYNNERVRINQGGNQQATQQNQQQSPYQNPDFSGTGGLY
ncbi:MAG: penicillin-binding protein 1A [Pseudomonadota bacterium]